ncbi:MAG TPA: hypothetical protein VGP64_01225 [Polyangia bacterium]
MEKGRPFSAADVGRKALILGRLVNFAGEPSDVAVESLFPVAMKSLPPATFIARLDDLDADWSRRAAAAKAKGGTPPIRRHRHQGAHLLSLATGTKKTGGRGLPFGAA